MPKTQGDRLSPALITLLKGVLYREEDAERWETLIELQARLRDQAALLGLELILDDAEGHAFLRQRQQAGEAAELPRLVPRRPLSFPVSLLLVLLRKRMAESDATSGESRLILTREDIVEMVRLFLPQGSNEARLIDQIDAHIRKVVDLGFLRKLMSHSDQYEVRRILRTFVDAQWLQEFDQRLADYRDHADCRGGDEEAAA